MIMHWFLVVWLVLPNGDLKPGYEVDGWGDRSQPSFEVCIERRNAGRIQRPAIRWECIGYFK